MKEFIRQIRTEFDLLMTNKQIDSLFFFTQYLSPNTGKPTVSCNVHFFRVDFIIGFFCFSLSWFRHFAVLFDHWMEKRFGL